LTVAEVIALKLRRSTGDIFLDTQLFTGLMFVGATICALILRSWKIVKMEMDMKEKRRKDARRVQENDLEDSQYIAFGIKSARIQMAKSLVAWKKV
jgi:hypothetical protein